MAQEDPVESVPKFSGSGHIPALARDDELGISNQGNGNTEKAPLKKSEVPAGEEDDNKVYPPTRKVMVVMLALYLSLFLVSLVSFPKFITPSLFEIVSLAHTHRIEQLSPQRFLLLPTSSTLSTT